MSSKSEPGHVRRLLNDAQHRLLAEMLDGKARLPTGPDRRRHERHPYMVARGVVARVQHPGGSWGHYLVRPRNISERGIAFFHGSYLHETSYCLLELRTRAGSIVCCEGHVVHARHVVGNVHEVGVAFTAPLDVKPFIEGDDAGHETPEIQFDGHLLMVHDSPDARSLLKFQAGHLGLTVTEAQDAPEALELARTTPMDLIIAAATLPTMTAEDLAVSLREEGCRGTLVRWGGGPSVPDQGGSLPEPFTVDDLITLFRRYLNVKHQPPGEAEPPLESTLWRQKKIRPRLLEYLAELEEQSLKLETLLSASDEPGPELTDLVRQVHRSAGPWGYPAIVEAGEAVLAAWSAEGGEPSASADAARRLLARCRSACRFRSTVAYAESEA